MSSFFAQVQVDPSMHSSIFAVKLKETKSRPKFLIRESFRACCGAGVIAGFPEPKREFVEYDRNGNYVYTDPKPIPQTVIDQCRADLKLHLREPNSVQLIILTDKQQPHYDELIKEFGFEPVAKDMYHTYAGNLLTVYCRPRYTKKKDGTWKDTKLPGKLKDEYYEDNDI